MKNDVFTFIVFAGVLLIGLWYVYANYYSEIYDWLGVRVNYTIFIDEVVFAVTVADEPTEWRQGLSGVRSLSDQTGKLFIFDSPDRYGIWMKDMLIPIDILWIDDERIIIHIEENISPDTYPETFSSPTPARFVLEVPAFTVESFKITPGQKITLPAELVPVDLQNI